MARGWESKSVEAQIDAAEIHRSAVLEEAPSPESLDLIRKKETILLSRTRVVRELKDVPKVLDYCTFWKGIMSEIRSIHPWS